MTKALYPHIKVKLIGQDGNAFNLLGICKKEASKHLSKEEVDKFMEEATSGDYYDLLGVCMKWFTVV